jgi:Tol biopolymer transport system component
MDRMKVVIEPSQDDTLGASFVDLAGAPIGPAALLTWNSSAPNVVRVDSAGVITGLQEGRATIHASTSWDDATSSEVHVVADLLLVVDRGKAGSGIVQVRSRDPSRMKQVLRDGARNRHPAFAPDRSKIAFASDRSGDFDLYVMDTDGASLRGLIDVPGDQTHPSWTPDGLYLVFANQHTGQSQIAITTITLPTILVLASAPAGERYSHPAVSPDGTTIVFLVSKPTQTDLAVIDRTGGPVRIVARDVSPQAGPVFRPAGEVLYAGWGADKSRGGIFRLHLHTGESTMIHSATQAITSLAVSRDGTTLAYVSGSRLWRVSFNEGDAARLALPSFERVTDPSF